MAERSAFFLSPQNVYSIDFEVVYSLSWCEEESEAAHAGSRALIGRDSLGVKNEISKAVIAWYLVQGTNFCWIFFMLSRCEKGCLY